MAEFWKTKQFKSLLNQWNKKLEQSGFEDAEIELKHDRALRQRATNSYRQANQLERDSRLNYFRQISYFANNTSIVNGESGLSLFEYACFPNELEKIVMIRHSEGAAIKEIIDELKNILQDVGDESRRKTVRFIIRKWQMKWGIRSWSLKQLNLKK